MLLEALVQCCVVVGAHWSFVGDWPFSRPDVVVAIEMWFSISYGRVGAAKVCVHPLVDCRSVDVFTFVADLIAFIE